jgi:hypothetical protein
MVSFGNTRAPWKVRTSPRAARICGDSAVTSSPSKKIRPLVGARKPLTTLNSVVLPAPFGPISPLSSPRRTQRHVGQARPPNCLVTLSIRSMSWLHRIGSRAGTRVQRRSR